MSIRRPDLRALRTSLRLMICTGALLAAGLSAADAPRRPAVGEVPPDVLGRARDGSDQTVGMHRGKVVIVTFWASWCGPCRKELPILGKFQRIVGRDHLEVIAVNVKEPLRDYESVIRGNQDIDVTWVHDANGITSKRYGVDALPNMFIIDREGRIAHVHRGYNDASIQTFVREIAALLPPDVLDRPAGGK